MCGIVGVVHKDQAPLPPALLPAMAETLRHRGPDAGGHALPLPWVGLAHRRLKVIDLSDAANQPMTDAARQAWIVFNGEIYNYRALRERLAGQGVRFRSQSDTEVILEAYRAWGPEAIAQLDGMFALAIVDVPKRRLLLARDRTGKKPLFVYDGDRCLVFGSEIKALLAHPGVPDQFDEACLPLYLTYGYVPAPRTFYRGIVSIEPATYQEIPLGGGLAAPQRYWRLPVAHSRRPRWREALQGVRERVTAAVEKRLVADVPLGAFLSGGIDSSVVVGVMRRLMAAPPHTFTIGFQGDPAFDETGFARIVAGQLGVRHTEFIVQPQAFELIDRLVHHHDQPFGDASAIPTFLLCQLAKEHVTVALNGDGGDEVFGGYKRFWAAQCSAQLPGWAVRLARAILGHGGAGTRGRLGEARRFLAVADRPWDERLVRWISYFTDVQSLVQPALRTAVAPEALLAPARRWLAEVPQATPLTQALYWNFHEYLPNDLHVKMDRCSMAHGLETRSPLLDTALIDYVAGLPDAWKVAGPRLKILLRAAFADVLPPAIRRRGKQGFGVPLDAWFRGALRGRVTELLLGREARINRYLEPARVRAWAQAHFEGRRNAGLALWSLATLETWLRRHERARPHPAALPALQRSGRPG